MKVRLMISMVSKPGRSGEMSDLFKELAKQAKEKYGLEFTVLYRWFGEMNTHYMMCDFESLAALEKYLDARFEAGKAKREQQGDDAKWVSDPPSVAGSYREDVLMIAG